jgi:hypothetical protein
MCQAPAAMAMGLTTFLTAFFISADCELDMRMC